MPKKIRIELDYDIGDFVYLVTDTDQQRRQVIAIIINPNGVLYRCMLGIEESCHYAIELSGEKQVI